MQFTYEVLELSPSLLNNTVLSTENHTHATEVADLGATHDKRVDVESATGENSGDAR